MCLVGPREFEATVVHVVQVGSAVSQQSIDSILPDTEPDSVRPYSLNDTERNDISCGVLEWVVLITALY